MIKTAIYDRYLSTAGGGERYSCKMAEILSKEPGYSVDLISDLYADLTTVSSRLNLDLSKVNLKVFPFLSEAYARRITGNYDIFINATYLSSLPGFGKKNLYLCYFPTPFDVDFGILHKILMIFFRIPALFLYRLADRLLKGFSQIEVVEGIYDVKRFMLMRGSWSSEKTIIKYKNINAPIRLGLKNPSGSKVDLIHCRIELKDNISKETVFSRDLSIKSGIREHIAIDTGDKNPGNLKNGRPVLKYSKEYLLEINSATFNPENVGAKRSSARDSRQLGLVLYNEQKTGFFKKTILKILGFIPLFLVTYPKNLNFLDTYDEIISISRYSGKWIKRLWNKNSTLLFPPVDTESFTCSKKQKIITSVGRFFPEHHNKKQLEMAKVFIELCKSNSIEMKGFKFFLIGGVEDRPEHLEYVQNIKKISKGYPIEVLTNISWTGLAAILSRSLIFWHSSGMGEDEEKNPEKFEHFGITTVEAMASGAIPVVINKGGQPEIIDDKKNGFLFNSWDELKEYTLQICSGKIDSAKIRENAILRAGFFSSENFKKQLTCIIEGHAGKLGD